MGIQPEHFHQIFQPFSQIDGTLNRQYHGAGLGLAISKRLCELMGGRIWVESDGVDGGGSTFYFTMQTEDASTSKQADASVGRQSSFLMQHKQMALQYPLRILLAEDNAVNRMLALQILRRLGYHADVAQDGYEVLAALERQPYDLILMDVQMPNMDGLTATREIRRVACYERTPFIVAMTANAMAGDREICLDEGMNDYLSKPIQIPELVTVLKNCSYSTTPTCVGSNSANGM